MRERETSKERRKRKGLIDIAKGLQRDREAIMGAQHAEGDHAADLLPVGDFLLGEGISPEMVAANLVATTTTYNRETTERRLIASCSSVTELVGELEDASNCLDSVLLRMEKATKGVVAQTRTYRMSLGGEARKMISAIKDVTELLDDLGPERLRSLVELVDLGDRLVETFGQDGMEKLADALLLAMDRRPQ